MRNWEQNIRKESDARHFAGAIQSTIANHVEQ